MHERLERLTARYRRSVERSSGKPVVFGLLMLAALGLSAMLFKLVPAELEPTEDRGRVHVLDLLRIDPLHQMLVRINQVRRRQ